MRLADAVGLAGAGALLADFAGALLVDFAGAALAEFAAAALAAEAVDAASSDFEASDATFVLVAPAAVCVAALAAPPLA